MSMVCLPTELLDQKKETIERLEHDGLIRCEACSKNDIHYTIYHKPGDRFCKEARCPGNHSN